MSAISSVLLVEDEPHAFARCATIVESHPRLTLAGSASSYNEAVDLIRTNHNDFDLLLTDLKLGDGHGTDLIRLWRRLELKFAMVITVFGDVESVVKAVEAGADGYLLKSGSDYEMLTAITTVLDGGAPISPAVAGHLLKRLRRPENSSAIEVNAPDLSFREIEILNDLAVGSSYKQVARRRDISPHTVADHVKSIYRKLSVSSRGEAVYKGFQEGLITLPEKK